MGRDCYGVLREIEWIFEERQRKERELEAKLLFQHGGGEENEDSYDDYIQDRRLDDLMPHLFHCDSEEFAVIPARSRPRAGNRCFLPVDGSQAVAGNNSRVGLHVRCSKCEQLAVIISSQLEDIACNNEDGAEEDWSERMDLGTHVRLPLPNHGTGLELDHSSRECHSCTIIRDSLLDMNDADGWDDDKFGYDFEEKRRARLQSLLRSNEIKLVLEYFDDNPRFEVSIRVVLVQNFPPSDLDMPLLTGSVNLVRRPMEKPKRKRWEEGYQYSNSPPASISSISTAAGESLKSIYTWFRECREMHRDCHIRTAKALPKRLLRIEHIGQHLNIRLVVTSSILRHTDPRYAALSYCWGDQNWVQLTGETEQMLLEGVSISILPATIRDSAKVAHGLGLQWLWVDALCIFQDSQHDFKEQAAAMTDIYSGCYVCIAAVGASKANDGLFSQRDPFKFVPCYMFPTDVADDHYIWLEQKMFNPARYPWPLHLRAWAVQERLLSPRTIKFGSYVSWECRSKQCDEFEYESTLSYSTLGFMDSLSKSFQDTLLSNHCESHPSEPEISKIRKIWYLILQEYSMCNLTYKSDRLRAISGIITLIERRTGWENRSGLWLPFLIEELLWETPEDQIYQPKRTGLRPTWSWIYSDGFVKPHIVLDEDETLELVGSFERILDTTYFGIPKPLPCISLHCLAIRIRREPGIGKTSGRTENLIIVEEHLPNEVTRIKFVKDFTESIALPQLFLVIGLQENSRVAEGLIVGLYPHHRRPYLYQRLGRGRGFVTENLLHNESLRESYLLV